MAASLKMQGRFWMVLAARRLLRPVSAICLRIELVPQVGIGTGKVRPYAGTLRNLDVKWPSGPYVIGLRYATTQDLRSKRLHKLSLEPNRCHRRSSVLCAW